MNNDLIIGGIVIPAIVFAYAYMYWAFECDCKEIRKNWKVIKPFFFALLSIFAAIILEIVALFIQVNK